MAQEIGSNAVQAEVVQLIPALRSFARRFHTSPTDIDDLVQDTVLKALANAGKFEEGTHLRSWMFTIMRNSFCTKFGLRKREVVGFEDDVAKNPWVGADQEWALRGHELEKAITELPDRYRVPFLLTFLDGISYEDAAARCQCPVGTIKSRVNRARHLLTKQLDGDAS